MAIRATNVTLVEVTEQGEELYIANLFGSSLDDKPVMGYANGTTFVEVDTGDIYLWDEDGESWNKVGSSGGGDDNPK